MALPIEERLKAQQLGLTHEKLPLMHLEAHQVVALQLCHQASRSLIIFSYDLDPPLYDRPAFIDNVKQLAIRSPMTRIRILLQENQRVQRQGHRLLELMRRLTSKIEIRRPQEEYRNLSENFLVADSIGYLRRNNHLYYEGECCFNSRFEASQLETRFDEIWESAEHDSALRRLHL